MFGPSFYKGPEHLIFPRAHRVLRWLSCSCSMEQKLMPLMSVEIHHSAWQSSEIMWKLPKSYSALRKLTFRSEFHGTMHFHWFGLKWHCLTLGLSFQAADKRGWSPLHYAAKFERLSIGKMLLEQGANARALTEKKGTPLMIASAEGNLSFVELLLENCLNDEECQNASSQQSILIQLKHSNSHGSTF